MSGSAVLLAEVDSSTSATGGSDGPGQSGDASRRRIRDLPLSWLLPGASLTILGVLLLGFAVNLAVIGQVRHDRDQQVAYSHFRGQLANATAPVGQVDYQGRLVAPGAPVAILAIPRLHLSQVVLEGTTSSVTMSGPGHWRWTPLPGQFGTSVVFGRQAAYGGPFRDIHKLRHGDRITATTGQGVHTYEVMDVRRGGDKLPPAATAGEGRLVLVTGDGPTFAPTGQLFVDARLLTQAQTAGTTVFGLSALPSAEKPMHGDSSAWTPLVLWAQLLVAGALIFVWAIQRWGMWQAWVVGVPVLALCGIGVADEIARLLPNML